MSRHRRRVTVLAGVVLAVAAGGAVAAFGHPDRTIGRGQRVVLFGDSLSVEAGPAFSEAVGAGSEADVEVAAMPGTAPCDALGAMRDTAATRPAVIVLQYVGNNASPCTAGPDGRPLEGRALAERYAADIRAAVEAFAAHGSRVVIAGPPPAPGLPGGATEVLDEGYRDLVTEWAGIDIGRVRYAPAGDTVAGEDRSYAARLPCLDGEGRAEGCARGEIVVRNPDRIHFCPTDFTPELTCPVYSSGARRYAREMARVALQALDPTY